MPSAIAIVMYEAAAMRHVFVAESQSLLYVMEKALDHGTGRGQRGADGHHLHGWGEHAEPFAGAERRRRRSPPGGG